MLIALAAVVLAEETAGSEATTPVEPTTTTAPAETGPTETGPTETGPTETGPAAPLLPGARERLYRDALAAWQSGKPQRALRLARECNQDSPEEHEPARLLEAYALWNLDDGPAALVLLERLSRPGADGGPADDAVRRAARKFHGRVTDPWRRDTASLFVGGDVFFRGSGQASAGGAGLAASADLPLAGLLGVRADFALGSTYTASALLDGPVVGLAAVARVPVGPGRLHALGTVGASLWLLSGPLVATGEVWPEPGLRTSLGLDARAWRNVGFSIEAGGWTFPGMAPKLPAYMLAWDARAGVVYWFPPR